MKAALHFRAVSTFLFAFLLAVRASQAQDKEVYAKALAQFRAGDLTSAIALFAEIEKSSPGTTDALLYEAKALTRLERFAEADEALRRYLKTHPDSDEALYLLGFVLHREHKPEDSLKVYTQAAALRVPTGDDLKIVGLNFVLLNDIPGAIKWLEKAVSFEPKNKDAWYYLGRAYFTQGTLPEASKAFSTVLELNPRDSKAENNLGLIFESQAKVDEALAAYRNAIAWQEAAQQISEQPYLNLGSLLLGQNDLDEAIASLQKAARLAPSNATCRLKLGIAYLRANRLPEAQRELETSTRIDPENAAAHFQLARTYKQLKQSDRAKAEFAKAEELQSHAAAKTILPQP
jgi:tetratricopeptide (TPR) repeat protein